MYDVYAEMDNGRRISLHDLEGSLHGGNSFTRYFKGPRDVKKVFLHVGPEHRHQRVYISIDYLPQKNSHERGYNSHH